MILQGLTKEEYEFFQKEVILLLCVPEIQQMSEFIQHGRVSCLAHSISVAYISYLISRKFHLKINENSLIRGAMLHDFFLYDWHKKDSSHKLHGYKHPFISCRNAQKLFELNAIEKDIIINHMWPLTLFHIPKSKEAKIVSLADKFCSCAEIFRITIVQLDWIA